MIFTAEYKDFLSDVHNAFWIVLGNGVENIQRIDSHISLRISKADQSVVKEYVKPLLVEFMLLSN